MTPSITAFDALSHGSVLALPLALLAGAVAGCNPCCVALYPAAAAVYCGANATDACCGTSMASNGHRVKSALAFVLGVATATSTLGIIAGVAGRAIGQLGSGIRHGVAAVPLIMGLHLLGWLRLPIARVPQRVIRNGWLGAYGAGFLLSLALTPCGTPVLAAILSYVVYKESIVYGVALLFFYGVGSSLPMVLVGTTAGRFTEKLENAGYGLWSERITGGALLALGLLLLWRA